MRRSQRGKPGQEFDRAVAEFFMRLALAEAKKGLGHTSPNPAVGAVLVKSGRVVARGYHARAGGPHAEIVALRRAGSRARGADLYSTLEPCNHFGRTPPCTEAIIAAGVRRVIVGCKDENPLVRGKGLARLKAAGLPVVAQVLEKECRALNEPFFTFIREKGSVVKMRNDKSGQKLVFLDEWDRPEERLKGAVAIARRLASIANRAKAA